MTLDSLSLRVSNSKSRCNPVVSFDAIPKVVIIYRKEKTGVWAGEFKCFHIFDYYQIFAFQYFFRIFRSSTSLICPNRYIVSIIFLITGCNFFKFPNY